MPTIIVREPDLSINAAVVVAVVGDGELAKVVGTLMNIIIRRNIKRTKTCTIRFLNVLIALFLLVSTLLIKALTIVDLEKQSETFLYLMYSNVSL